MKTTYWVWKGIAYRLRDNKVPEIWVTKEQGWRLTNVLMGLIVGGDPTVEQVTAEEIEEIVPGATAQDARIIEITEYPVA